MKTYAFKTKDSFRVDVKASTLQSALNKIKSFPHFRHILTGEYFEYNEYGFHSVYDGWKIIDIGWNI